MTLSRVETAFCEREIGELIRTSCGVEAAMIATGDGFEVARVTRGRPFDAARLAGLSSSVLALGRVMARELDDVAALALARRKVLDTEAGLTL
jgi:predicted regulator of Ras-like GTPase activity (Roadblock/LC7/MglB family)